MKRLKWWQKVDETGTLNLDDENDDAEQNHRGGDVKKSGKRKERRPTLNHRSFHNVLVLTRQNKSHYRNLRQQTHTLKRVVLSELTKKVYEDKRLWWGRWEEQVRELRLRVDIYYIYSRGGSRSLRSLGTRQI